MFKSISSRLSRIIEGAGTMIGYRRGTEEPKHSTERLTADVEIRRYPARIAAETTVISDEESARNVGFRRLAGYIFGANRSDEKIAMTAPVAQEQSEKIAMTAPVAQESSDDGRWVIRFFMPSDKTMDNLPAPADPDVTLVTVPPQTVAVRRFNGRPGRRAVAAQTVKLMDTLRDYGIEVTDRPAAWFYDPPWTVPALRRNEIAVPVSPGP